MPTSSVLNEEMQEVVQPDEDIMFRNIGRDRSGIRMEFAPVESVSISDKYVNGGDSTFIHPDSDMPTMPTAEGESMGNLQLVRETGDKEQLFRAAHGLTVNLEDEDVDREWLQRSRDAIISMFDKQADLAFLQGIDDRDTGTVYQQGVFDWLDDNIPASNIINANNTTYDVPANIIVQDAYEETSGEYVDTTWDLAVAPHNVWGDWNHYDTHSGAEVASTWALVDATRNGAGVGVNRRLTVPDNIGFDTPPSMSDDLEFSIDFPTANNGSDDDVMYLLPDHGGDYFTVYESGTPRSRTVPEHGWRERLEYMWRGGTVYNNSHRLDDVAKDAIKIENVSTLF